MALLDLKVRIIPDMTKLKQDIQRGITGVGGKKPSGKGGEVAVTGFGKVTGILAGLFALIKSIDFIISPVMKLLSAMIAVLLLPLIPILKPTLMGWASIIKFIKPIMVKISSFVETLVNMFGGGVAGALAWIWGNILEPIWNGLKASFEWVIGKIRGAWEGFVNMIITVKDWIRQAFTDVINAIINVVNKLPLINIPNISGAVAPSPGLNFSTPQGPTRVNQGGTMSININNPIVQTRSDIQEIADKVSRVLRLAQGKSLATTILGL